jgi:hypothetical protein
MRFLGFKASSFRGFKDSGSWVLRIKVFEVSQNQSFRLFRFRELRNRGFLEVMVSGFQGI